MTTTTVQAVVAAAQELSPTEQLEVIQALTRVLQQQYPNAPARPSVADNTTIRLPATVRWSRCRPAGGVSPHSSVYVRRLAGVASGGDAVALASDRELGSARSTQK